MRSRRSTLEEGVRKLIVDTSFLLPALGVEVEDEVTRVIPYFRFFKVYYLEVCILEAMWRILRLIPEGKLGRVEEGLKAIRETYTLIEPPPKAYIEAYKLYHKGYRDYINVLLYCTARELNIPLLTIDRPLIEFLKEIKYDVGLVLTPEKLIRGLKRKGMK